MPTIGRTMPAPGEYVERVAIRTQGTTPASMLVGDPIASATRILREQGMPPGEIEAVVAADEPQVLRRYMELHRERLDEWVAAERRALGGVERFLALAILERTDRPTGPGATRARPRQGRFT